MREQTEIEKQVEAMIPKIRARAEAMALEAIGQEFSVRSDRRTVNYGRISKCWVSWVGRNGMKIEAMWKVVLERNGIHNGPFQVKRIPGGAR